MAKDYTETRGYGKKEADHYSKMMPKTEMKVLKDGYQDGFVYDIPTETQKYDLGRMRYHSVGTKGYAKQAFEYDY